MGALLAQSVPPQCCAHLCCSVNIIVDLADSHLTALIL